MTVCEERKIILISDKNTNFPLQEILIFCKSYKWQETSPIHQSFVDILLHANSFMGVIYAPNIIIFLNEWKKAYLGQETHLASL
jgi:hypothetical protein